MATETPENHVEKVASEEHLYLPQVCEVKLALLLASVMMKSLFWLNQNSMHSVFQYKPVLKLHFSLKLSK